MALRFVVAGLMMLACLASAAAGGTKPVRSALIIVNSRYTTLPSLVNPESDGDLVSTALKSIGFDSVTLRHDLTGLQMRAFLDEFSGVAEKSDVALVYFAGGGFALNGMDRVLPSDSMLSKPADAAAQSLGVDDLLASARKAKKVAFVAIDACRNNPFVGRPTPGSRTMTRGLHAMPKAVTDAFAHRGLKSLSKGEVLLFSTAPGTLASDGIGDAHNSPFALAFAARIVTPGAGIDAVVRGIRDDVAKATGSSQVPFVRLNLGSQPPVLVPTP